MILEIGALRHYLLSEVPGGFQLHSQHLSTTHGFGVALVSAGAFWSGQRRNRGSPQWYELESQDTYPAPGQSWSRYFRNQDGLAEIRVGKDMKEGLEGAEAV